MKTVFVAVGIASILGCVSSQVHRAPSRHSPKPAAVTVHIPKITCHDPKGEVVAASSYFARELERALTTASNVQVVSERANAAFTLSGCAGEVSFAVRYEEDRIGRRDGSTRRPKRVTVYHVGVQSRFRNEHVVQEFHSLYPAEAVTGKIMLERTSVWMWAAKDTARQIERWIGDAFP